MAYDEFDISSPVATQTAVSAMDSSRKNLNALRDATVLATFKGWTTYIGTPRDQPVSVLYSKGQEHLRQTITYGNTGASDGLASTILHTYSSNAGSTFITVGVQTVTYDASSNVQQISWS